MYNKDEYSKPIRYKINPDIFSPDELKNLHICDNWHGILAVLEDWFVIIITIIISECYCSYFLYFISLIVLGSRHRALATLLHESSHKTLAKNKYINIALGTIFGGWCVLQSWSIYHKSHVKEHHNYLGNRYRDPDYRALLDSNIYGNRLSSRSLYIYLLRIVFDPFQIFAYMKYLFTNRIFNKNEPPREFIPRTIFVLSIIFLFYYFQSLNILFWYWFVPLCTTSNWIGSLLELSEHYPLLERYSEYNSLYLSRNRLGINSFEKFFLGIHEESWHLVHHLYPRVPFWNQEKLHNLLMKDPKYADLHKSYGWISIIKEMAHLADSKNYS